MCLIFIYTNPDAGKGEYRLILASNRDETYTRPAADVHQWLEDKFILGGRDVNKIRGGGTWLALSTRPLENPYYIRIAALLNIEGEPRVVNGIGRGCVVANYLMSDQTASSYLEHDIEQHAKEYYPFNFVAVEITSKIAKTYHFSNVGTKGFTELDTSKGLGIGNSLPESPLKKVQVGQEKFQDIVQRHSKSIDNKTKLVDELLELLQWKQQHLPDPELERRSPDRAEYLSSIFVNIPHAQYGTRTHSIILMDDEGHVDFIEKTLEWPSENEEIPKWKMHKLATISRHTFSKEDLEVV